MIIAKGIALLMFIAAIVLLALMIINPARPGIKVYQSTFTLYGIAVTLIVASICFFLIAWSVS